MDRAVDFRSLGLNVRKYREEKSMSAEKLSRASGVSKSHINNIESANSKPSLEALVAIANALDISLDILLCDSLHITKPIKMMEYAVLLEDCEPGEAGIIVEMAQTLKRKLKEQNE
ncbi:MAG: helix-turn-helix transcriptional regulator [Lachnospiraceae bacterium]|nr:helix-turn-helix transcriptional regulator [Lachnospiraceae bacterium]